VLDGVSPAQTARRGFECYSDVRSSATRPVLRTLIGRVRYLIDSGVLGQPKKSVVMSRSIRSAGVGINIKDWETTSRDLIRTRYPLAATLALLQVDSGPDLFLDHLHLIPHPPHLPLQRQRTGGNRALARTRTFCTGGC
jgi:hypothetical protein